MDLNVNPISVAELIVGIIALFIALLSYFIPKTKKIKSLFYIRLSFLSISITLILSGLSMLYMNIFLSELSAIFVFIATIFLIIGINYSMKDSFFSISLIPAFCLGTLLCYLSLQYDMIEISYASGYQILQWGGLLGIIGYTFGFIWTIYIFYSASRKMFDYNVTLIWCNWTTIVIDQQA